MPSHVPSSTPTKTSSNAPDVTLNTALGVNKNDNGSNSTKAIPIVAVGTGVAILALLALIVVRRRKRNSPRKVEELERMGILPSTNARSDRWDEAFPVSLGDSSDPDYHVDTDGSQSANYRRNITDLIFIDKDDEIELEASPSLVGHNRYSDVSSSNGSILVEDEERYTVVVRNTSYEAAETVIL